MRFFSFKFNKLRKSQLSDYYATSNAQIMNRFHQRRATDHPITTPPNALISQSRYKTGVKNITDRLSRR